MINSVPFGLHPSRKTIYRYFNNTIKTSEMHLSRRTYVPLFLQTVKNMYFGPTSPLLVLSTPEQYYNFFGFTKTVWFEYENIFQNYQVKKGTCATRNESQTTHCLPFTAFPLPSRTQTSLWRPAHEGCTSQGAPAYPCSPTCWQYIFQSHQSPYGPLCTKKTLQFLRIYLTVWFEHENIFQNYQVKNATHTI